jgi:ATP-dependent protease HslVU (ClpYQ) peptidase subunit
MVDPLALAALLKAGAVAGLAIAGDICVFTNHNFVLEEIKL